MDTFTNNVEDVDEEAVTLVVDLAKAFATRKWSWPGQCMLASREELFWCSVGTLSIREGYKWRISGHLLRTNVVGAVSY